MQHNYHLNVAAVEHHLPQDHRFEVRHRNRWGATVTTRHYSEEEAAIEKRWRTAHGFRTIIRAVVDGGENGR